MAVGALLVPDPASSAPRLPPVQVSTTVLEPGDSISVSGQGCTNTGLGVGYHVDVQRGDVFTEFSNEPPMSGGSFTASDFYDHLVPGHVSIAASCLDGPQENNFNDPYPLVALDVRPPPDPPIESALSVSPAAATPGETVSVHADHLRGGGLVTFYLYPSRAYLGEAEADGLTAVDAQLSLPAASTEGEALIVAVSAYRAFGAGAVSIAAPTSEPPAATATTSVAPTTAPPTSGVTSESSTSTTTASASSSSSSSVSSSSSASPGVIVRDDKAGAGSSGALLAIGGGAILASAAGLVLWRRRRGLGPPPS